MQAVQTARSVASSGLSAVSVRCVPHHQIAIATASLWDKMSASRDALTKEASLVKKERIYAR